MAGINGIGQSAPTSTTGINGTASKADVDALNQKVDLLLGQLLNGSQQSGSAKEPAAKQTTPPAEPKKDEGGGIGDILKIAGPILGAVCAL